ncbi:MAG: glutamate-5-semialdehyde dehydrogenase, partial [Spirochaetia bacterium]|nr:glutamate-5-semialdehyde dehydrogenase [Spirochaetia bacterium]
MSYVTELCEKAKRASFSLATLTSGKKDAALTRIAEEILLREKDILSENEKDLVEAKKSGLASAMVDRLTLTTKRVAQMAQAVREIRDFPDPVGEVVYSTRRPDGLQIYQERVPVGVLCVIFESRPNVVIDIAALSLKSGNAAILRGGKEAFHSNQILGRIVSDSVAAAGLPADSVQVIDKTERSLMEELLKQKNHIDIVVPRGGESLIRYVSETSLIPVVRHDKGLCHTFVDASADAEMAVKVAVNAKVQRPGTCNATECLLIHKDYPQKKELVEAFLSAGVELRGDAASQKISSKVKAASDEDYDTEYL